MKSTVTLLGRVLAATGLTFVTHFVAFVVCWAFRDPLFRLIDMGIRRVVDTGSAIVTGSAQAFEPFLSVAISAAVLVSSPFVIAFWLFILSGPRTRRYKVVFLLSSIALAGAGTALGYFALFPLLVGLTEWGASRGLLSGEPLLDLLLSIVVGSAIAFQIVPAILALRFRGPSGEHGSSR